MSTKQFGIAFQITSWFECGDRPFTNPVGNFDGQGLSWGPRQTNIGQGTLQPLLKEILALALDEVKRLAGDHYPEIGVMLGQPNLKAQLNYVIQQWNDSRGKLLPLWASIFSGLGSLPQIQKIFMDEAEKTEPIAEDLAKWIVGSTPKTIRVFCVAYDIVTQNGGLSKTLKALLTTIKPLVAPFKRGPNDWLAFVVWFRAMYTYFLGQKKFAEDVLDRKLLIVEGRGKLRGEVVDLEEKFSLSDQVY